MPPILAHLLECPITVAEVQGLEAYGPTLLRVFPVLLEADLNPPSHGPHRWVPLRYHHVGAHLRIVRELSVLGQYQPVIFSVSGQVSVAFTPLKDAQLHGRA
jgi:hypothetical protein